MGKSWTFGQKLAAGFSVTLVLAVLIAAIAVYALRAVVENKDHLLTVNAHNLIDSANLNLAAEERVASARGYVLTKDEKSLQNLQEAQARFLEILSRMRAQAVTIESKSLLDQIERLNVEYENSSGQGIAQRKAETPLDVVARFFENDVYPKRRGLAQAIDKFQTHEEKILDDAKRISNETASSAITLVVTIAIVAILSALAIAVLLTRTLTRQIGSAVQHIQSSSAELQTAANQQATGAKEQASSMTEISTTVRELLSTASQIAESAKRVSAIASATAENAGGGSRIVEQAQEAIAAIKKQVDQIVNHMLDLGRKSQQASGILDIINELAEQTNILAINATIEAAGAGESGRRFAIVADEIRKLADRVGGSSKEIRDVIEEIRSAVNTTVMATESGSKATERGTVQFSEVSQSFRKIAEMVETTTEAAREIELSTKQQSSAVGQVDAAVRDVSQASKETETSTRQTQQTASELAKLSHDLAALVHASSSDR